MLLESIANYTSQHYVAVITSSILLSITAKCFYELCISPLARFPGPKHAAVSRIPNLYHTFKGDLVDWVTELHRIYGNTVRVAPNELSYSTSEAWRGIYGHAAGGKKATEKDTRFYGPSFNSAPDIIRALGPDHSRFRRNFSHAFSERAIREQQPLICHYVDMLIDKLRILVQEDPQKPIEIVHLYNLTTFDIMGDLTFGDSLDLLAGTGDDSWVSAIFLSMKTNALRRLGRYYPWTIFLAQKLIPQALKDKAIAHYKACQERVDRRIDPTRNIHRPDIWGIVMDQKEELRLSHDEMYANSQVFMVAGTETTATALSGLTYHLLMKPEKLDKLIEEIRSTFQKGSDIEIGALGRMKYLNACIEEGLRIYPPVPVGLPRVAPDEGLWVCGEHIPCKTALSINHWATYHDPENFKRPNEYIPERWLSDEFVSDNKAALQPFSFGPRNCLGKNLAYSELRMILAKVLFYFDLSLAPVSVGWDKQRTFFLWEKNPLMVHLKPRAGAV
ncbi:cytochrome P450 [Aspergillus granulosus]|uniref:Cytochrome P450 n=1 Tax=Aspergillus granulosus TaxID=176169 RepID=A0ABR4HJR9_9EURO